VDLLPTFLETVKKYSLFSPGHKILVSLSGGADSLALFHLLFRIKDEWRLEIEVFHLDHSLREESSEQAKQVCEMVRGKGIPCHCLKADIKALHQEKGGSLQEVARQERMHLLKKTGVGRRVDRIALGHQANDQAETLLLNLIRGSGIGGLAGIPYGGQGKIIHPLLDIWREEIEKYCKAWDLEIMEDPSNLSTRYRRNKIRLEVLPWLEKEFNPKLQESLWRTAKNLQEDSFFLEEMAEKELAKNWRSRETSLELRWLLNLPVSLRKRVLLGACRKIAPERSFYFEHLDLLDALLRIGKTGSRLDLPGLTVEKGYRKLYFFPAKRKEQFEEEYCYYLSIPGQVIVPEAEVLISAERIDQADWDKIDKNRIIVDGDKIGNTLMVRSRKPGDRFWPLGSPGQKKLKDFFINSKIDRWRRRRIPLLVTEDGNIVWVVGCRVSEKYRVEPESKNLVEIKCKGLGEEKNGSRFEANPLC